MSARGVLRIVEGDCLGFWCPGCEEMHVVTNGWAFNGNYDKPTFTPSVLVTSGHYTPRYKAGDPCWCTFNRDNPGTTTFECFRCHTFVTDGMISFLADCTHALKGKQIPMKPFE